MNLLLRGVLLVLLPLAAEAAPVGDCTSEKALTGRADIVFCEPWESPDWWKNGYLKSASIMRPVAAVARDVGNTSIVSAGCVSGSCLRVEMKQYQSGALAIHWPLKSAGLEPQELYLRYYIKLGENFNPDLCAPGGAPAGNGGKFPGLADVRDWPEEQCGNGGQFGDGLNCWSMRSYFRNCRKGGDGGLSRPACTSPGATTRFGSYLYYWNQDGFNNNAIWDNEQWGQGPYLSPFGSCDSELDIGGCGRGTGGQLENNRWYQIEMYVRMNTAGKADGAIRGWVNGVLSYEKTNVMWRIPGHHNLHVRTIWLNVHAGGESVGLCTGSYIMLDQLVAATGGRIGGADEAPGVPVPTALPRPALVK